MNFTKLRLTALALTVFMIAGCASQQSFNIHGGSGKAPSLDDDFEFISKLQSDSNTVIIYDASGSMALPLNGKGELRYQVASKRLEEFINSRGTGGNVGFIVYGSRLQSGIFNGVVQNEALAKRSCSEDIDVRIALNPFSKSAFKPELDRLQQRASYRGDTPLGGAIVKATDMLALAPVESPKTILLLTDGAEECAGKVPGAVSPVEAAKAARAKGIEVHIVTFGVGIDKDGKRMPTYAAQINSMNEIGTLHKEASTGEEIIGAMRKIAVATTPFFLKDSQGNTIKEFRLGSPFVIQPSSSAALQGSARDIANNPGKIRYEITTRSVKGAGYSVFIGVPASAANVDVSLGLRQDSKMDVYPSDLIWK